MNVLKVSDFLSQLMATNTSGPPHCVHTRIIVQFNGSPNSSNELKFEFA